MSTNGDKYTPHAGRWEFDESVTENFDKMLENSIPEYRTMRDLTHRIGRNFVRESGNVVDFGASRGEALNPFVVDGCADKYYALEISGPMVAVLKQRYQDNSRVEVLNFDLRDRNIYQYSPFTPARTCLALSIFTLQFIPIEHRQFVLRQIYKSLVPGGAFILVEKVLGNTAELDELLVSEYYKFKNKSGYSYEDIQRKRAALEGVLVPVTMDWNRELLRSAGFNQIDCFYRNLNFGGLVAIKE